MDGDQLTTLRQKLGLTQTAMAAKMGLSRRAYIDSENRADDEVSPRHTILAERIAQLEALSQRNPDLLPLKLKREIRELAKLLAE